jgi:uncharacterized protein (DUF885 family)
MRERPAFWAFAFVLVVGVLLRGLGPVCAEPAPSPSWSPPSTSDVVAALDGLPFDAFVETSYRLHLLRFPESLTHLGLAEAFGVRHDRLNDYSPAYVRETREIEREILDRLLAFDREALSPEAAITFDVCLWYWDDLVRGQPFADYDYPISHYYFTSLDWALFDLLTEVHPFASLRDAEDYVIRLYGVDAQFDQIIDRMEDRAEKGIVVPRIMIDWALPQLRNLAYATPHRHPFYATLEEGLGSVGAPDEERERLLESADRALADEVLPAYRRLLRALESQRDDAPSGIGFGQYPGGEAFYAYALRHQNQTDLSAAEIHEIGLREVARLQAEIEAAASALGIPAGASLSEIYRAAEEGGGTLRGPAILAEYERLLEEAAGRVGSVFLHLPSADVTVVPDPIGGYYRPAPLDGSRAAEFAAPYRGEQTRYRMPTLVYHETLPGHHLQIGLAQELDLPLLRRAETFLGHTEGWALYAERLAWELGWYGDDPYGNLGRLSDEMMRAVRLVVDTGIHVLGWSFDEAVAYFAEHTGQSTGDSQYNILRYAAWPGQSTAYMIGLLTILDLRARVQAAEGEAFDLAAFHDVVLRNGSLPLSLLVRVIAEHYGLDV